ncbi:MAG: Molybdopterin-guanine dinucleotide biosynthesis adapter protein [Alphaproteobacteria bacterium MarineAlpha11_Bin1]|nr:MAG: Molybdopterin-guanine dinucleotide biosynthesis adapter protein [Alphaproteobacteria bacterium MarineAlpha11_Bin1]|tara:strand:- start:3508 stop:4047 length:540 start_codon:yes stop_codon:yes gene_type:complete
MTFHLHSHNVIGITGWSGSGKTSLIIRLIPEFRDRGLRVATIKHAHHAFDIDTPGKDSYEHRSAGAAEVLIASEKRWAIMHENREIREPSLDELLGRISPVDIVLVEGFKNDNHMKIEVHRPSMGTNLICAANDSIIALASDGIIPDTSLPVLDLNDNSAIADFILNSCALTSRVPGEP